LERTSSVVIIRDQELLVLALPGVIRSEWKCRGFFLKKCSGTIIIDRESVHSWVIDEAGKGLMSHTKISSSVVDARRARPSETRGHNRCSWGSEGPAISCLYDTRDTRIDGGR
jgi:hypothetical protein